MWHQIKCWQSEYSSNVTVTQRSDKISHMCLICNARMSTLAQSNARIGLFEQFRYQYHFVLYTPHIDYNTSFIQRILTLILMLIRPKIALESTGCPTIGDMKVKAYNSLIFQAS